MNCFYCGNTSFTKSNEHVISNNVLQYVFGPKIRNATRSSLFNKKIIFDHEQKISDICCKCNTRLSSIDCAGLDFVKELDKYIDLTGIKIKYTINQHLWLLKTHLNFIRMIKEKYNNKSIQISRKFPKNIIQNKLPSSILYMLLLNGYKGKTYYWDENDSRRIQYFSYRHVSFSSENIICSNFTIKALDTFLLLPNNRVYANFFEKCLSVLEVMKEQYEFNLQLIVIDKTLQEEILNIEKIVDYSNYISKRF